MYVDETGGTEETVTSEEMTVTVDGTEYDAELNADLSGDGQMDAAVVDNADGTKSVYADTDGDQQADAYAEVDPSGNVVAEARFDEASGEWVAVDPSAAPPADGPSSAPPSTPDAPSPDETSTSGGDVITAELPSGEEVEVGPATLDTNGDSVNDTSVAEDPDGVTYYFTDADGDGEADYLVVVAPDGTTQALEHQGGGQWAQVEGGSAPAPGGAEPTASGFTGDSGTQAVQGVAKIDALSGQWISPN